MGAGGEGLGGTGAAAGDDVPEVCVGVLPQLFPRAVSVARGPGVRLLHHLAGGAVLQGGEGDMALDAKVPHAAGEVELRLPLVLLLS